MPRYQRGNLCVKPHPSRVGGGGGGPQRQQEAAPASRSLKTYSSSFARISDPSRSSAMCSAGAGTGLTAFAGGNTGLAWTSRSSWISVSSATSGVTLVDLTGASSGDNFRVFLDFLPGTNRHNSNLLISSRVWWETFSENQRKTFIVILRSFASVWCLFRFRF